MAGYVNGGARIWPSDAPIFAPSSPYDYSPDANTLGLWHMNEGDGATAYDASGNDAHGTAIGSATVDGRFARSRLFSGSGEYVNLPEKAAALSPGNALSFEAWVNLHSSPSSGAGNHIITTDNSSMVRTMELILGLPPMTQFDAASTPMYASFSSKPDLAPYRCRPANVDLTERNQSGAYEQERSGEMDFSKEDRIPDVEFSEIIWKSIRRASSPMPPPVRSAFVRVIDMD